MLEKYPEYTGSYNLTGWVTFNGTANATDYSIVGYIDGMNDGDALQFHVHEGYTCDDADMVGDHLYFSELQNGDPWLCDPFKSTADGNGAVEFDFHIDSALCQGTVLPFNIMWGHSLVVHVNGDRVACGLLELQGGTVDFGVARLTPVSFYEPEVVNVEMSNANLSVVITLPMEGTTGSPTAVIELLDSTESYKGTIYVGAEGDTDCEDFSLLSSNAVFTFADDVVTEGPYLGNGPLELMHFEGLPIIIQTDANEVIGCSVVKSGNMYTNAYLAYDSPTIIGSLTGVSGDGTFTLREGTSCDDEASVGNVIETDTYYASHTNFNAQTFKKFSSVGAQADDEFALYQVSGNVVTLENEWGDIITCGTIEYSFSPSPSPTQVVVSSAIGISPSFLVYLSIAIFATLSLLW